MPQIKAPTLVIVGDHDVSTPWSGHGERLAREIPGAKVLHLAAAHLSNMERPRSFSAALLEFLLPRPDANVDPLHAGFEVRRSVLGDAHVDKAIAATTEFTREFQELITRYAWGTIWSRPELDWRTRRLLVLAITASLGRWEEFALHLRAGLASDLELCDLKEVLLQTDPGSPLSFFGFDEDTLDAHPDDACPKVFGKNQRVAPTTGEGPAVPSATTAGSSESELLRLHRHFQAPALLFLCSSR